MWLVLYTILLPFPPSVNLVLFKIDLCQINVKAVGQIQKIIQHIGKFFAQIVLVFWPRLALKARLLANRLGQLANLLAKQQKHLSHRIFIPALFAAGIGKMFLQFN